MRRFLAGLVLFATALVSTSTSAQSVHFKFTDAGAGYNAYGVYIGTYGGIEDYNGLNPEHVGLNCVDYLHEVSFGQEWDANISYLGLGDITQTRHPELLEGYKAAAWLISQYTTANVQAVQGTLWNLFQNPGANWPADPVLLAQAYAPHPSFDYSKFYVVTDVNANGPNDAGSVQEFVVYDARLEFSRPFEDDVPVTTNPEPSSIILFATGIAGVGAFRVRRHRARNEKQA